MTHYAGIRWTSAEILLIEEKLLDLLTKQSMTREQIMETLKVNYKKLERALTGLNSYDGVKVIIRKPQGQPTLYRIETKFHWR